MRSQCSSMLSQSPIGAPRHSSSFPLSEFPLSEFPLFAPASSFVCPVPLASIPCLSTSIINASTMPSNLATSSRNLAFSALRRSFSSADSGSVPRTKRALRGSSDPTRRSGSPRDASSSAAASRRPVNARSEEMSATVRSHARSRPAREDPATEARRHPDDAPELAVGTLRALSSAACSSKGTGAPARRSLVRRIASSARRSFARRYASSCGR